MNTQVHIPQKGHEHYKQEDQDSLSQEPKQLLAVHHRQRDSVADRRHKHCRGKGLPGRIQSIKNRHLSKAETQAGNQPPRVPEVHLHHKGWTGTGNLRVQLTSAHLLEKKTRFHQVRRVNRQAKLTELWYHVQRESCRKPVSYPQTVHLVTATCG